MTAKWRNPVIGRLRLGLASPEAPAEERRRANRSRQRVGKALERQRVLRGYGGGRLPDEKRAPGPFMRLAGRSGRANARNRACERGQLR